MKTYVTLLLVLLSFVSTAQRIPINTVYFKNGSEIKGKIIEDNEGETIKVQTVDKSIWVFNKADILKVVDAPFAKTTPQIDFTLKSRWFTQVQMELMPPKPGAEGTVPAMLGVAGFQVNKHLSAGFGTGVEAFHISMLPLFGDLKYYFLNDITTPFIGFKGGYAFPLENQRDELRNVDLKSKGGLMGGVEVGFIRNLSSDTRLTFSMGYRYQQLVQTGGINEYVYNPETFTNSTYVADRKVVNNFNRLVVSIGIRFW